MLIRTANESDFKVVHELMYQIFEKHLLGRPDIYKKGDPYSLEQFKAALNNENNVLLLAQIEDNVVGVCHMIKKEMKNYNVVKDSCTAFIEDFCVDKHYQRKGIGKELYEASIKKAKEWDARRLELNVWKINEEARKFYDAVGLRVQRTIMETSIK
ncbi:GNAT family N-acetyltransferase [Clostridium felsineum]|uniref:GNAT family N-acetyltransferase n=1 Tax=Clostridium felsineum TaxID=36839 RepID=UPI00098C3849|nr:GNAT family N-acetyltransferase [Clostridium felsineum]URZ14067.1 hypothetical protein CLFE_000420 [Clostridium felsineum DSM 794]